MQSSTLTISASVELWVLRYLLVEVTTGKTLPMESPPPVCPLMLRWTVNDLSIHHFRIHAPPATRMSGIFLVFLRYFIRLANLFKFSMSGSPTPVVRNENYLQVSGIAFLLVYSVFATRLWNPLAFS